MLTREEIEQLRQVLRSIEAGPVDAESVGSLAASLSDLTGVVSTILDALPVKRDADTELGSVYPFVVVDLDPNSANPVPMSIATQAARHRIILGVYTDGSIKVLKNNMGPHDAIPVVSVRGA